ncbi:MAG: hypothetical protein LQ352_006385 [Teloschistes flavicans]|nr:MAG: hypothetical protein LQ352_006385 [Teloschistes flavicans]
MDILETSFIYLASALLFSEVYIWSVPQGAELRWVVEGRPWERARLNERPIYLRSLYIGLALLQTFLHLYCDYDRIEESVQDGMSDPSIQRAAYVAQEPLKRGQPLSEDSKDPNGSLINGLKAKKTAVKVSLLRDLNNFANDVGKSFAYWELAMICRKFPERRVSIFKDIDRLEGAAWSQISMECLRMVEGVTSRISAYGQPSTQQRALIKVEDLQSLPRLGTPLKQDSIFMSSPQPTTRREMMETKMGTFAKSVGDYPVTSYGSPIGPKGTQYIEAARDKLLTPEQRQALTLAHIRSQFYVYLTRFLHSWLGQPFRQTFARRIRSIAFGQPFSELIPTINAVDSLTSLVTASLKEDAYGKVAKDIPLVMRTFIVTYQTLDRFAGTLSPHWTDVEFSDSQRQTEDVLAMLDALKHGLGDTVKAFSGFSADLGIVDQDIRIAKAIAGIA